MAPTFNEKCPAVKRLMKEAMEMKDPTEDYSANPIGDNLFEWHFTIRGSSDTEFKSGIYHGRITFPNDYPMKPPNIILLTPNGRFEVNEKICLSISGYHPETWQPSWSVRTALVALIAFMPTPGNGTIGSLDYSSEERQILARRSQTWECTECGKIKNLLTPSLSADYCTIEKTDTSASYLQIKNNCGSNETVTQENHHASRDCADLVPSVNLGVNEELNSNIVNSQCNTVSNCSSFADKATDTDNSILNVGNGTAATVKNSVESSTSCKSTAVSSLPSHSSGALSFNNVITGIIIGIIAFLICRRFFLI